MLRAFNMGVSLVVCAPEARAEEALEIAAEAGETAFRLGRVVEGAGVRYVPVSRTRAAILISGRGSNMAALLEAAAAPAHPVSYPLVLSNDPSAPGLERARALGAAAEAVDHRAFGGDREAFERALTARLEAAEVELVALAGFMRLLTPVFVRRWRDRLVNIHPALLPAFRGLDTHARALAAGVAFHGCTVHLVREAMDDGPILGQAALRVRPGEDAASLGRRVLALEHRLFTACMAAWAEGALMMDGERPAAGPIALSDTA
jgi:phosphoribosylglycinamide formyltransferase, formyltetrahydrofolate-dependent